MNVPRFIMDEKATPQDAYEWTLWAIIGAGSILSALVMVPFVVFVALTITLFDFIEG